MKKYQGGTFAFTYTETNKNQLGNNTTAVSVRVGKRTFYEIDYSAAIVFEMFFH